MGKYTGEMAAWLAQRGHDVRVVTAPPYYPAWAVSPGYSATTWRLETWNNVAVWRCPLWVPPKPGGAKRLVHLASFALSSLPVMLRQVFWRPDVVWAVEPPLFCAPAAWATPRLSGGKAWLHVQDYEVDAAFDLGLLKEERIRRAVAEAERWLMQRFDVVSTISLRMMDRAAAKGVAASRQVMFPNWVDVRAFVDASADGAAAYRRELGIPMDAAVALYSGNMGGKQGLEILADVARLCAGDPAGQGIHFVFCGGGVGRADLVARCEGLAQVHFMDLQPAEKLPDLLGMADIHLLPQRADAADLVMPSKLTGMLASARPVVATAQAGTELATVVQHCGLAVLPENAATMAAAVQALAADARLRERLGKAGRQHALQHMDKEAVLQAFEAQLLALSGKQ